MSAHRKATWLLRPPKIVPVNPTGSGDAMTAGFIFGHERGWQFDRILAFASAAGAANARKVGSRKFHIR
jgi:tagatose 6-phosphate kinase